MRFTPGPWGIMDEGPWGRFIRIVTDHHPERKARLREVIATIDRLNERQDCGKANARLIAASPELFSACKSAAEWFDEMIEVCTSPGTLQTLNEMSKALKRAISKVEEGTIP